jgi:hypothetical protein
MNYPAKIISCISLFLAFTVHAGVVAPTAHSRANCGGFNESVTWQAFHSYWWRVESHHFLSISEPWPHHVLNTGKNLTWRAAAYHAQEGYSSRGDHWYVVGYHFYYPNGRQVLDTTTMATDCSVYDGWWDH